MPSKAFNFGRGLGRHMCLPITTVIGFSLILMYIFILYQPSKGPGIKQRMGWQSWDVVNLSNKPATSSSSSGGATAGSDLEHAGGSGVDWWNVTTPDDKVDFASLPLDVWSPLLPHDTGLSEIAVTRCMMQPELAGDLCAPKSTSEDDAIKGKWVRVPRDLNLEAGVISGWLNIYYRRTRRQDIRLITELKILGKDERPSPDVDWFATKTSLRAGIVGLKPMFLWYKLGKAVRDMTAEDRANLITELDVLYGEDMPWYGFDILQPATIEQKGKVEATHICYRRGVKIAPKAPPLHFNHDGNFKILQVADLHFSVSQGTCRDTLLSPCTHSDNLTQTLVGHMIDAEKPDLVVFTGDQLNGQGTSWDPRSVLAKFSRAVAEKGIPWAAVFGNHDEEDGLEKEKQVDLMRALPYSLVQRGPKDIHGVGNYVLKVYSPDASKTHILTLYFLDSGSYSKGFLDWFGFFNPTEYDYIRQSQTDWFLQESASIQQIERPFRPDDAKDMGDAWRRQEQITPITRKLAKPNALMFFHMPLTETYNKADMNPRTGKALDIGKTGLEPPGNAKGNDQFFEKGILRAMESDHVANGQAREVKVIANGHCHITENCRRVSGIWFCFGGGGSYSGYSKIGFDRRFRVYDVSEYGETIKTYKRTEHDEVIDKLVLAGTGSAPLS